jgi:hypothetical protein
MPKPDELRAQAVRLLALAIKARETNGEYADRLVGQAMELQDEATAMEEAAMLRPLAQSPQQPNFQQQEQEQSKGKDKE